MTIISKNKINKYILKKATLVEMLIVILMINIISVTFFYNYQANCKILTNSKEIVNSDLIMQEYITDLKSENLILEYGTSLFYKENYKIIIEKSNANIDSTNDTFLNKKIYAKEINILNSKLIYENVSYPLDLSKYQNLELSLTKENGFYYLRLKEIDAKFDLELYSGPITDENNIIFNLIELNTMYNLKINNETEKYINVFLTKEPNVIEKNGTYIKIIRNYIIEDDVTPKNNQLIEYKITILKNENIYNQSSLRIIE